MLWLMNLGFAAGGAAAPTPTPAPAVPTPAGISRHKRRHYVVAIDGQDFIVDSADEAMQILQRARAIAERQVERKAANVERRLKKRAAVPVVSLPPPVITVPAELKDELAGLVADIQRLYAQASMEMEMRLLLLRQQLDEDDDEDVILLS